MSTKVAPAPAKHATKPVQSEKQAKDAAKQEAEKIEEERVTEDAPEEDAAVSVATEEKEAPVSETSLAGDFAFDGALAEAAAAAGSLVVEGEGGDADVTYAQMDDDDDGGPSGVILLIGAIALIGLGVAALASGGDDDNDIPVPPPPPNANPTITVAGTATVDEDDSVGISFTTADADGNTVTVTGTATNGTVAIANGVATFTPNADYSGPATVTLNASDGNGGTATATVNVTVTAINDAPEFAADEADITVDEDDVFEGDISSAASDVDGDDLTFSLGTQAANGTAVVNDDGTYTYTPDDDFNGTDSYTVIVSDGELTDEITVNVTVNAVNDAPVAGPNNTTTITVENDDVATFLIDFDDPDGDDIEATVETAPENGTLGNDAAGNNTYTPDAGFVGTDSFEISVTDGEETVTYTVTVNVIAPLDTEVSLDGLGTPEVPVTSATNADLDADGDDVTFTDTLAGVTNVVITGFGDGDVIDTNATETQYGFTTSASDPNDLRLTFNDGTQFNQIVIDDILPDGAIVFDYDSAVAAVGFEFMTFG